MVTFSFRHATRVQQSLLSGVEKRALIWMAERMPSWIHPDHLTLVGLFAMLGAGAGYWLSAGDLYRILPEVVGLGAFLARKHGAEGTRLVKLSDDPHLTLVQARLLTAEANIEPNF